MKYSLVIAIFVATPMTAQWGRWQITLRSGQSVQNVTLVGLQNDTLIVQDSSRQLKFSVHSLKTLEQHRTRRFWRGAGYGAAAGGVLGAILFQANPRNPLGLNWMDFGAGGSGLRWLAPVTGLFLGAMVVAPLGGMIDAANSGDRVIDLDDFSLHERILALQKLLREQSSSEQPH